MRFNKTELSALASQPSHQFDKEGVLLLRERHDTFFRRQEGKFDLFITLKRRTQLLYHFINISIAPVHNDAVI